MKPTLSHLQSHSFKETDVFQKIYSFADNYVFGSNGKSYPKQTFMKFEAEELL